MSVGVGLLVDSTWLHKVDVIATVDPGTVAVSCRRVAMYVAEAADDDGAEALGWVCNKCDNI